MLFFDNAHVGHAPRSAAETGQLLVAGHRGDLLDQRTGDVGQLAVGDHKQRFHVGGQPAVGHHHGQFGGDVGDGAHAADHDPRPALPHKRHGQPVERADFHVLQVRRSRRGSSPAAPPP